MRCGSSAPVTATIAPPGWPWTTELTWDPDQRMWFALAGGGACGWLFFSAQAPQRRYGVLTLDLRVAYDPGGAPPLPVGKDRIDPERDGARAGLTHSVLAQLRAQGVEITYAELRMLVDGFLGDVAPKMSTAPEGAHIHGDGQLREEWSTSGAIPSLVTLTDVVSERVAWFWPGRVPLGKVTTIDGDPGLGKSTICLDLAARGSTGGAMPDGTRSELGAPVGVVICSAEDGLGDTIRPRLEAAGADLSRIVALVAVHDVDGERLPTLGDLGAIESAILQFGARLLIVDPLMAYLPDDVRAFSDHHIRRALAPLAALAERMGVAVVVVRHLNKSAGMNPLYRGGGSIGIIGAARSAFLIAADPDDPEGRRRILAPIKTNLAATPPALAYHLEPSGGAVRVCWEGVAATTAASLLASQSAENGEETALDEARGFLREALADGPRPSREIQREADGCGILPRTLRRAREAIGVKPLKEGKPGEPGGRWLWALPPEVDHETSKMTMVQAWSTSGGDGQLPEFPDFARLAQLIADRGYPPVPGVVSDGGADAWWAFGEQASLEDWRRAAAALDWEPGA